LKKENGLIRADLAGPSIEAKPSKRKGIAEKTVAERKGSWHREAMPDFSRWSTIVGWGILF